MVKGEDTTILFHLSSGFKEAIAVRAQQLNKNMSFFIREVMAEAVGYDISNEIIILGRPRKYATNEARKNLEKTKRVAMNTIVNKLIEEYEHAQHVEDAMALNDWLEMRLKRGLGSNNNESE